MRLLPTITAAVVLGLPVVALGAPAHAAAPTCAGEKASIVGNAKANKLTGTAKRDVIWAGDGNDTISGLAGNDLICGGGGADRISGGPDDDRIFGELDGYAADKFGRFHRAGDTIVPGAGNDYVDPGYDARAVSPGIDVKPDTISYAGAPTAAVVDLRAVPATVGADGADTIVIAAGSPIGFVGTPFNDVIRGTYKSDRLHGMAGDDQIFGQDGDDVITPDGDDSAGNDIVDGGSGADKITSVAGYDTLIGGQGSDVITNTSLNKTFIKGGSGGDTVTVPVPGEAGFDVVGNSGQDKLRLVAYANPALFPTVRIDQRKGRTTITKLQSFTVVGKIQSFTEVSLPGNAKTIYKGTKKGEVIDAHPDFRAIIKARGGSDVLTGSDEKDLLIGGRGFDLGFGKGGKDTCKLIERRKSC
ncbi:MULTISPECIES: calcium-binding protein [Nocardioides]|uniref:calcium-binding protein n=1 Tax=Nocardioides TaxID=1839 RepID=UPI00032DBC6E|nr:MULTISPECIES: calcium-binding protein [Nocardioides]EON24805.1 RTX toxin [Nocardioides sp. CF8]